MVRLVGTETLAYVAIMAILWHLAHVNKEQLESCQAHKEQKQIPG